MRRFVVVLAIVTFAVLGSRGASACVFGSPRDEQALSPDGRLRFESQLAPGADRELGDQAPWLFRLVDVESGRTLWERRRRRTEGLPVDIRVDSSGWVVLVTEHDVIETLDVRGAVTGQLDIWRTYSKDEMRDVPKTDCGPVWWMQPSYLTEWNGGLYYVAHGAPMKRFVMDVRSGKTIKHPTPGLRDHLKNYESEWALTRLETLLTTAKSFVQERGGVPWGLLPSEAEGAIRLVRFHRIVAAVPILRSLEIIEFVPEARGPYPGEPKGALWTYPLWCVNSLRSQVQNALRTLGESPMLLPIFCFPIAGTNEVRFFSAMKPEVELPLESVRIGMTVEELLTAIGAPKRFHRTWFSPDGWIYRHGRKALVIYWNERDDPVRVERIKLEPWTFGD